jgi:hypothetical protein
MPVLKAETDRKIFDNPLRFLLAYVALEQNHHKGKG